MTTGESSDDNDPSLQPALVEALPSHVRDPAREPDYNACRFAGTVIFRRSDIELDDSLHSDLKDYLNPDQRMGAFDQVEILDRFYGYLGVFAPLTQMDKSHFVRLQTALRTNPGKRVLPIPLNSLRGVRQISGYESSSSRDGLVLCQEVGFDFARTRTTPMGYTYSNSRRAFYRDYFGGLSTYSGLTRDLKHGHKTIRDEVGRSWAFPLIEAAVKLSSDAPQARPIWLKPMDPLRLPDTLAMLRTIQHAAGFGDDIEGQIELSSAQIYKTHLSSGIPSEKDYARGVVGVTSFNGRLAVGILPARGNQLPHHFIAREVTNGL